VLVLTNLVCRSLTEQNNVAVSPTLKDTLFGLERKNGIFGDNPLTAKAKKIKYILIKYKNCSVSVVYIE
jgi:hypothetical protein